MTKKNATPDSFEVFFAQHFAYYQSLARKDFDTLQQGPWVVNVSIDPDDDFALSIGDEFTVYGKTKREAVKNTIERLKDGTLTYCKTWSVTDSKGTRSGDYSDRWFEIRDEAIRQLNDGETAIQLGGNQTITIDMSEKLAPDAAMGL